MPRQVKQGHQYLLPGPNVKIHQRMLTGMRWKECLHNGKNKEGLIDIIASYLQLRDGRKNLTSPFIINNKYNTIKITSSGSLHLFSCNHEEAGYRIVLHAILPNPDAIIVEKDTDVLVLLVWAYNHSNVQHKWFLKYEHETYADISLICSFLGKEMCAST